MKVIFLEPELESFKWMTGLYVVDHKTKLEIHLKKLNPDGTLNNEISVTGKGNKGIKKTNLTYHP